MAKDKTKFCCKECGFESAKWLGKCTSCQAWNSMVEEKAMTGKATPAARRAMSTSTTSTRLVDVPESEEFDGFSSGDPEFDRVLGGKIIGGSLVLIGGSPGMGKSTMLLSSVDSVSERIGPVIYFSGEESEKQTKIRWKRLGLSSPNLYVQHTTDIDAIEQEIERVKPVLVVIDSIQTLSDSNSKSSPGSPSQVTTCVNRLMGISKGNGVTVFVVGQVTKSSEIAGPKLLEHMVDTVLYLEGDKYSDLRLLRAVKNRFGSSYELGVFLMEENGMIPVENPSELLLSNRDANESGSAVVCISDARPLLIETQALVTPPIAQGVPPRRTSQGFNRDRLSLLVAVLEKKCGVPLSYKDVFVNVVGGMKIVDLPSADLGITMALYSSDQNKPIDATTVILGEVGLTGEVRPVSNIEQLLNECEKVGFQRVILPRKNYERVSEKSKKYAMKLVPVGTVRECISSLFPS